MGKILGLDIGTNSIGWAIVDTDTNKIVDLGCKIFPNLEIRENNWQKRIVEKLNKLKKLSIIKIMTVCAVITFLLTVFNNSNWQFWLNLSMTILIALVTLQHQQK